MPTRLEKRLVCAVLYPANRSFSFILPTYLEFNTVHTILNLIALCPKTERNWPRAAISLGQLGENVDEGSMADFFTQSGIL